ncbi:class I SAM-dependent methyltransferase [Mesorhizobium sp.]|uniref:class I SAM-dependent methyltransferase n=1 Tax=Mesorhizobium sp. TaxID=1871066 RepID=UPI000FE797E2|nr:class I SAM-dependent methyltransferase [Mesorhizobium sp.]RWH18105.1 MAG: class I SAM-dependent methyltransferase [Mesorhizobium sp.]RWH38561.1 MAG: class I SAM-dependent methyltransferase [Mesorhizobium sp.]TIM68819.1 MAG: class I SAM-dependent methyltransferase [Mesorhizobium sp.]TIR61176.1 MAG: class I SAM-dependent methyltransferase [Mesorhizobium sp.]TIR67794.1 MAG: class I SAM-dependent methyltransferase [Mesorhizobium sp.]
MSRDWEQWDVSGIAGEIQTIWRSSHEEDVHREQLANIVSGHVSGSKPSVLEVGCGTGLVYEKLVTKLPDDAAYIGVDSSIRMLEIARETFPEGQFLFGDGYELFFRDQEFDIVLCFEVLGHIPQIDIFVSELLRVAKKKCIFTTWPSESSEVAENYERIDDVRFLHRRYSNDYILSILRSHSRNNMIGIDMISLHSGGLAYIVSFT